MWSNINKKLLNRVFWDTQTTYKFTLHMPRHSRPEVLYPKCICRCMAHFTSTRSVLLPEPSSLWGQVPAQPMACLGESQGYGNESGSEHCMWATPDRASITPKQPLLLSLSGNMLVHSHLILNSGLSTPLISWWWVPKLFMRITAVVAARLSIYPNHNSTCSSYEGMAKDPQSCVKDVQNRHTSQQTNKVSPALLEYTTSRL